jgi:hypothetical protein
MSWELWHTRGNNLIDDFDTIEEALDFVWAEIAASGEETVRAWWLRDGSRQLLPLSGEDLLITALVAHDVNRGAVALMDRLTQHEQRLQALERLAGSAARS